MTEKEEKRKVKWVCGGYVCFNGFFDSAYTFNSTTREAIGRYALFLF